MVQWEISKLAGIILVIIGIVVVVIIVTVPNKSIANELGNLFNIDFLKQPIEESSSKELALAVFGNITNIYNNCLESNDKTCTCTKKTFPGFEKFPRVRSTDTIRVQGSGQTTIFWLENENEEQPLGKVVFRDAILNCFMTYKKDSNGNYKIEIEDDPLFIRFNDPDTIYIQRKEIQRSRDRYFDFIEGAPVLFKDHQGNICFVTEGPLTKGLSLTDIIKQETINDLNSLNFCFPSSKDDVEKELNRLKGFINNCQNNSNCRPFTFNLPEDYTILHRNNGVIGAYYLHQLSSFNLVYSIAEPGSYCYDNERNKKYHNGDTLKLEKKVNKVCLELIQVT